MFVMDNRSAISLKDLDPVAAGKQRYVFRHPDYPGLLIKITRASYASSQTGNRGRWYKLPRRYLHHTVTLRELREQLAVRAAAPELSRHIQEIVGFVETDLGYGVVSRAVCGRDGNLAPSLRDIVLAGRFTDATRADLEEFYAWMLASPVVLGDVHIGNLVYGYEADRGDYFAVIDGIGDKNLIPFNSISQRLNRRSKLRRIARINRQIQIFASDAGQQWAAKKRRQLAHQTLRPAGPA